MALLLVASLSPAIEENELAIPKQVTFDRWIDISEHSANMVQPTCVAKV